ncbi:MAG: hypothetical protein Q7K43_06475 [Candidatus Woesearchaeota archaeon]|nr:hypothetical protein [Candidatus Woesearchaeota archaeon]
MQGQKQVMREKEDPQRNFKTLGSKLLRDEADLVNSYCKRKGTTPSKLIRSILLKEINVSVPNNVAGNNVIKYKKEADTFSWSVLLDNSKIVEVISNMSPNYLEDLTGVFSEALAQRNFIIAKKKAKSVPVPAQILKK